MNLEARISVKSIWWDGEYGGVKISLFYNPNYGYTT